MATLAERIISLLCSSPGLTDREITDHIAGTGAPQQPVNGACRQLEERGTLRRTQRADGRIGNYLRDKEVEPSAAIAKIPDENLDALAEDSIKLTLDRYLTAEGWTADVAWGRKAGIDIDARRGQERWIIEVKGRGSLSAMRVNYFIGILGETLQRMSDPDARYSIALPDLQQFRRLWDRLPELAKRRTQITAIFVSESGKVSHVE